MSRFLAGTLLAWAVSASVAAAQAQSIAGQSPGQLADRQAGGLTAAAETRPATTTFYGDTGLWFVPTAETLPHGFFSASGYRAGFNRQQGFTNVSHLAGTFAAGLLGRLELFGSWSFVTRIDRDVRPLFIDNPEAGAWVNTRPFTREGWSGNQLGDLFLGAKVNVLSESRQQPAALALRGIVKLPTGDKESGAGTGAADAFFDAIVSKEIRERAELSAFGGVALRANPDDPVDLEVADAFRYGVGAALPSRGPLRVFAELHGEIGFDDTLAAATPLLGADGSLSRLSSDAENIATLTLGLNYQTKRGIFVGAGVNWFLPGKPRGDFGNYGGPEGADYVDFQFRIGYHPGARVYMPPPPPPPPPPLPPANRPPQVKARCEPCTVEVGQGSTVSADAQDPDGDTLTYRWTTPAGTLANPGDRQSGWTAPNQEGTVPVTVSVADGRGGTASDTVNIRVVRPPRKEYVFEDVHFDFDRYTLTPEATTMLDEVVAAVREDPQLRLELEGHTCDIGTAEYNLALGERRAMSVRDYLVSRGVTAERLRTVSYGEERPKHDNSREETRRLNRRAALVVRIQ